MFMESVSFLSTQIEIIAKVVSYYIVLIFPFLDSYFTNNPENIMIVVGFGGQALFAARFLIQWITSENAKKSVIPIAFWYFSITGGVVLLTYAIWRKDPVIIAGQSVGILIYARNLYFIHKDKKNYN